MRDELELSLAILVSILFIPENVRLVNCEVLTSQELRGTDECFWNIQL